MRFILPLVLLVIAGVVFFGYIGPVYGDVQTLRQEEAAFDAALERSQELIAIRDTLLATYNALPQEEIERLEKLLPNNIDNVRLILDIDSIAAQYGMTISNLALGTDETLGGGIGPSGSGGSVKSVRLSFTTQASYETFKQFLMDLEDSLRIVDIVSVSFSAVADDRANYSVTLETYWLQ